MIAQFEQRDARLRFRDVLGFGLRKLSTRLPFFVGIVVVLRLGAYTLDRAELWLRAQLPWSAPIISVMDWALGFALSIGIIRVSLKLVAGPLPALADVGSNWATFSRFALASLFYTVAGMGLGFLASVAGGIVLMFVLDRLSAREHMSFPVGIGMSAIGAVAAIATFRVGRWLFDRQFYGHLIVDRSVGPKAAFRGSATLARPARRQLLAVLALIFGIGIILATPIVLLKDPLPVDPRVPWSLPHITTGWPRLVNSAVIELLGGLAALDGWLLALALSFAYRTLSNYQLEATSPESPDWHLQSRAVDALTTSFASRDSRGEGRSKPG